MILPFPSVQMVQRLSHQGHTAASDQNHSGWHLGTSSPDGRKRHRGHPDLSVLGMKTPRHVQVTWLVLRGESRAGVWDYWIAILSLREDPKFI